jgi:hypothetical protein
MGSQTVTVKKWYESSTLWVNIIPLVLLVLDYFIRTSADAQVIALLTAIANIINRLRVTEPTKVLPVSL